MPLIKKAEQARVEQARLAAIEQQKRIQQEQQEQQRKAEELRKEQQRKAEEQRQRQEAAAQQRLRAAREAEEARITSAASQLSLPTDEVVELSIGTGRVHGFDSKGLLIELSSDYVSRIPLQNLNDRDCAKLLENPVAYSSLTSFGNLAKRNGEQSEAFERQLRSIWTNGNSQDWTSLPLKIKVESRLNILDDMRKYNADTQSYLIYSNDMEQVQGVRKARFDQLYANLGGSEAEERAVFHNDSSGITRSFQVFQAVSRDTTIVNYDRRINSDNANMERLASEIASCVEHLSSLGIVCTASLRAWLLPMPGSPNNTRQGMAVRSSNVFPQLRSVKSARASSDPTQKPLESSLISCSRGTQ